TSVVSFALNPPLLPFHIIFQQAIIPTEIYTLSLHDALPILTMTVAAEISPQGIENSLVYIEIPTGTVRHLSSLLIVNANKYSFQAAINARIPVVNTPVAANGNIILRNV